MGATCFIIGSVKYRLGILTAAGLLCLGVWLSTLWPVRQDSVDIPLQFSQGGQTFSRTVTLAWPAYLRQGETGRVEVRLVPDGSERPGGGVALETRLEMTGLPANDRTFHSVLLPQAPISLTWEVKAEATGDFEGKVWLWVGGGQDRQMILASPVALTCIRPLGMPTWLARWGGAGGFLLFGGLAGWVARRRRRVPGRR